MRRSLGPDQGRGRGGEEGDDPPRRQKGPDRRPVLRRPVGGLREAHHQQGRGDGDGVRSPAGGAVRQRGEDEEACGGDPGGVRCVKIPTIFQITDCLKGTTC